MSSKRGLCFVDDDDAEIGRVRKYLTDRFIVGAGKSVDAALKDLRQQGGRRKPHVFLLDMYGAEGPSDEEAELRLAEARAKYLRAEAEFYGRLGELRQTTKRGFNNLDKVRKRYKLRRVPVAFFTRKGTLDNAVEVYEREPKCPVLKKPDPRRVALKALPNTPTAAQLATLYDDAFKEQKDQIADDIGEVIQRFSLRERYGDLLIGVVLGVVGGVLATPFVCGLHNLISWCGK